MQENKIDRVIVGIDGSNDSMHAASLASYVAEKAKAQLQLVHATKDLWVSTRRAVTAAASSISASSGPVSDAALVEKAHANIATALARRLPEGVSREVQVESGRAGPVLEKVAQSTGASLIVIGGKHHSVLERWLAGSTAHYLARNGPCPILVTASDAEEFSRILVAVDRSSHARAVLNAGERLAAAAHGALRVVHVLEEDKGGLKRGGGAGLSDKEEEQALRAIEMLVHESAHDGTEVTVLRGELLPVIHSEIRRWDADVLVIGSHGMGFESRQLLGRLSEECLDDLPTSTMFVPLKASAT